MLNTLFETPITGEGGCEDDCDDTSTDRINDKGVGGGGMAVFEEGVTTEELGAYLKRNLLRTLTRSPFECNLEKRDLPDMFVNLRPSNFIAKYFNLLKSVSKLFLKNSPMFPILALIFLLISD